MPLTMNKRCSGSDRPRSARLRRRPSPQEDIQESVGPQGFEREQSDIGDVTSVSSLVNLQNNS